MGEYGLAEGQPVTHVSVGTNEAVDITDRAVALGPGEYFGRIDGSKYPLRFLTLAEGSEERIEMAK
jgi:hypothetical protein